MLPCSDCAENARLLNALAVGLLPIDARVDLLEKAKAAALEFGAQTAPVPRQPSFRRMMTGLALAATGARLLRYRFEDKDCREPEGLRCDVVAGAGAAGLVSGLFLKTVLVDVPASPSVTVTSRRGGGVVRAVLPSD